MKQIRSRIYYEKSSGVILVITPEKEGFVQEMSKKQDMEIYEELKFRDINDIDYIELEYGKLKATFDKAKCKFKN
jgi:hypothetical protein